MSGIEMLKQSAGALRSSAGHVAKAEELALKAAVAIRQGDNRLAALHTANAQRAFDASLQPAHRGQQLIAKLDRDIDFDVRASLQNSVRTAVAELRTADAKVFTEGPGALVSAFIHRNGITESVKSTTGAVAALREAAGQAHSRAVLPGA